MVDRLLLGTRKGLFHVDRLRGDWRITRTSFLADNVPMLLADPRDGALYAALNHGHFGSKVHRSYDHGADWTEIACPAYPPKPAGRVESDQGGKPLAWKLELIWALEAGHASQPGKLLCGTVPGGLFESNDAGMTWQLNEALWLHPKRSEWVGGGMNLPGIHSICVHPQDANHVTLGVSCGGVWQTTDGGDTWNCRADGMWAAYMPPDRQHDPNVQDPHRIVQCAAQPHAFWAQHHNGVFRSTDGSASWQELKNVPPSTFGFAVAVDPQDAETAWFVPAMSDEKRIPVDGRLVVARTRDGGRSFDVLTAGLPQEPAYDIVYRHALAVDETGRRLALGSTTGSVWISDDAGDRWQCLSKHLPPVYCVRFVSG